MAEAADPGPWMARALELAEEALEAGEVPVGALLVLPDGRSWEGRNGGAGASPLDHAEMAVLRAALFGRHPNALRRATLYVTVEPCLMCLGAMVHARIGGLVYGCEEPRFGGVSLLQALWREGRYPHRFPVAGGLGEGEARRLLQAFFEGRRKRG